jgi:GTP-binding protein
MWRENQKVAERLMDSMDLERERGITIASKNGSFEYKGHHINIIDTPGHADFGGQVERVLRMADGVLLLVDAQEGPMPQTYFVLKKALALALPVIVVINKIDKPAARCDWVVDQVFDLFVKLGAPDHILDFPIVYASSLNGYASLDFHNPGSDMIPLMDEIVACIPAPNGDPDGVLQLQVSSIDYSSYLGRLGIGKLKNGKLEVNQDVVVTSPGNELVKTRITKLYRFERNSKVSVEKVVTGDIVAVAGLDSVTVGDTYTAPDNPAPLPALEVDPPTISMNFIPNDSPFAGTEGKFVTSRHLDERLKREALSDVALLVEGLGAGLGFKVSGRGELHISILIETMRREGYEFQVTRPQVIFREDESGKKLEPYEETTIDVAEEFAGAAIQMMGARKGVMLEMSSENGMTRMKHKIPTRGLLGFRSEFMSETKGMGVLTYIFAGYDEYAGEMRNRKNGVLVAMANCTTVAYALFNLQNRGKLFLGPGINVYKGQIVGENCRTNDLAVNPAKGKQLTNVRAAGSDDNVILVTPVEMSLEDCIDYINDDELVEVTPESIRLRKADINKKVK